MEIRMLTQQEKDNPQFQKIYAAIPGAERHLRVEYVLADAFYGAFDRGRLCGFAQIEERCKYFPNSTRIKCLHVSWEYNRPEFIEKLLLGTVKLLDCEWVCMDVDRKHDFNLPIYLRKGMRVSLLPSPKGDAFQVLTARKEELLSKNNIG